MEGIVFTGTMRPYAVTWDLESYRNAKKWKKINEAVGIRNELEKHTFCIWFNDSKTASTSRLDSRHIEFNCSHLLGVRLAEARPHAKRYGTMNVVDCYRMRVSSIIQIYIENYRKAAAKWTRSKKTLKTSKTEISLAIYVSAKTVPFVENNNAPHSLTQPAVQVVWSFAW